MKGYFLSVILTAVFGGISAELLPEGSSLRPHLKLVTGLCVLAVLVLPAKDVLVGIGSFFEEVDLPALLREAEDTGDYESIFEGSLEGYAADEVGRCLSERIEAEFELKDGSCRATAVLSGGEAERVLVCLSGSAILTDPDEVEAFVYALLGCPCDVVVE